MQNEMLNVPHNGRMRSPLASTMNLNLEDDLLSNAPQNDPIMRLENQAFQKHQQMPAANEQMMQFQAAKQGYEAFPRQMNLAPGNMRMDNAMMQMNMKGAYPMGSTLKENNADLAPGFE